MNQNFNLKNRGLRLISFIFIVFIMADIIILMNYIFRDYGKAVELHNIKRTAYIFGVITTLLFLAKRWLEYSVKSNSTQE